MFKRSTGVIVTSILLTATLLAVTVSGYHPALASPNQEHISPTQFEIGTVPSGYFELTVSPAVVYASVGEPIEIRCTIDAIVDQAFEISSVDVLLFGSNDSMIREQAMTNDSYWSAHTVYTVVGDEAYFKAKVNFVFPDGPPGEHSEYGGHRFPVVINQESTQFRTGTAPLGYFELTVSPAEVYANVGEQIEIRCTIDTPLVDTPIKIGSVYLVLFDSHDSIIRERAMTTWNPDDGYHYLSANTEYTIVGDEAYYRLKINYSLLRGVSESGEYAWSGEYAEYTAHYFPIVVSQDKEPIEIVSVLGPVGPVNPGGPGVKITMKNVGVDPVVSLTATLEVGGSYNFTFDVTPSNPLEANKSTSRTLTLIGGGGFSSDGSYPLTINATLQNGANFVYTKLVQIAQPRPSIWGLALAGVMCALFQPHVAILAVLPLIFVYLSKSGL